MTDTVVGPKSPNSWDVSTQGDYQTIGEIKQEGARFTIELTPGSILVGVKAGPHPSKDAAMSAIAAHTNGTCRMLNPG